MQAIWNETVIADSERTVVVEGNHYFPRDTIREELVAPSSKRTVCPWKGQAHYLTINVDGDTNPDAAWFYPEPKDAAAEIKDHVAFWRGVDVRP